MNEPLISVIFLLYKTGKCIDQCIHSIVNQTPDRCSQICDKWAREDSRISVIHKENGGASSARNMELDICTGEYISFADSEYVLLYNQHTD